LLQKLEKQGCLESIKQAVTESEYDVGMYNLWYHDNYRIAGNFRMVLFFVYFVRSIPYAKIKTTKFKHAKFVSSARDLRPMPHAVASASAGANGVSVLILCQGFEFFTNGSSPNTLVDMVAHRHRFNLNDAIHVCLTWHMENNWAWPS
jgi:hypothetical protein